MLLFLSVLLAFGIFFSVNSIHNCLLKETKKKRALYELFSGLILSALSLCLIVLI